jgi:hypothetical protein
VNCLDARRALGAEPNQRTPELEAHLAACPACADYAAELARLDRQIRRALEVPVPAAPRVFQPSASGASNVARRAAANRPRTTGRRWLALAASAVLVALVGAALWSIQPREALATALVTHVVHEPQSLAFTEATAPPSAVRYVLARSGVRLEPGMPRVSYAQSCWFRGWYVPHLVVQTGRGPVTVIVLPHERVVQPTPIDEGGYRGLIVPAPRGALAVLSREAGGGADVAEVAALAVAAVRFVD